jgi:hypothetical protein
MARVFASQHIGSLQQMQGAQTDVGQVANGRGQHVQTATWVVLSGASCICSSQHSFVTRIQ